MSTAMTPTRLPQVTPGMPSVVGRYARARSVCPVISAARCCGGFMANLLSEDLPIRETGTLPLKRAALQSSAYPVLVSSESNEAQPCVEFYVGDRFCGEWRHDIS